MTKKSIHLDQRDLIRILRSAPDLYLILNSGLEIVDGSDAYIAATMVNRSDVIGRNIFEVFPDNPQDIDATGTRNLRNSLENVLKSKCSDTMAVQKYDVRRSGGEKNDFEVRYWSPINSPVLDDEGEVLYIIHRVEDVTEFIRLKEVGTKQFEQNELLKSKAGQMEKEIYQRAQEIQQTNQQLRDAKDAAEQANQAKSTFLATMSHEIRTPLNGVIGMTSVLEGTILTAQQQEYLKFIRVSGESLLTLINDILDFSKIEAGRLEIDYADFELRQVIEDAVEMIAYKAHEKGLAIGALMDVNLPQWVNSDGTRLSQILINLLNNAVKFTHSGQIELNVSVLKDKHVKHKKVQYMTLLFEVKDTGIGISSTVMKRLFQSFSQGDASVSRKYGGSGLGLVICQRILEFLNGEIGVDSVADQGSRFWFTLPVKVSKARSREHIKNHLDELKGMRVLAVDDNHINRCILTNQLNSWGMRCDVAKDGFEALEVCIRAGKDDPYQLILLDYNMPGMDGLELAEKIATHQQIHQAQILMLTSLGLPVSRQKLDELNILNCLTKPVRQSKLYNAIVSMLFNTNPVEEGASTQAENQQQDINENHACILLAEDNAINQQVAIHILERLGYRQVDIANNGLEAIRSFEKKHYDLVFMDCQMPELDGYAATGKIREMEKRSAHPPTPIIAMTAHALKGDKELCLKAGMNDYIAKPINIPDLEKVLKRWISTTPSPDKKSPTPVHDSASLILDVDRLQLIFGNNDVVKKEFLHSFIQNVEGLLKEVDEVIQKKDTHSAKAKCHRLKGTCGNVGANRLYQFAMKQESLVLDGDWQQAHVLHVELLSAFDAFKQFVEARW